MNITVQDEFDPGEELAVVVQHRLLDGTEWGNYLLSNLRFADGAWRVQVSPRADATPGTYVFRVNVTDNDGDHSGYVEFPVEVEVLNNPPSTPEVRLTPARPMATSTLEVEIVRGATDLETSLIQYRFTWMRDGVPVPEVTGDSLPAAYTSRGENWSVEVRAFDGLDVGPAATAWKVIENAPPGIRVHLPDPEMPEDTQDSNWLDLSQAFEDPDGDALEWYLESAPQHIVVTIDPSTGVVTLAPEEDWNGAEEVTFVASDGELQVSQTVTVTVQPVNDRPRIVGINGFAVTSDPMEYTIKQDELLTLVLNIIDVENHGLYLDVNTSLVELDEAGRTISFQPGNEAVGTLRFGLKVADEESPTAKVTLNFTITVENENDPMDDPRITNPANGEVFKWNETFYLMAYCFDPDIQYGQELNFSWSSNVSGHLGYGSSLTLALTDHGIHLVTLTVNDGKFQKSAFLEIEVLEKETGPGPQDPDPVTTDGTEGLPIGLIVGALVVVVAAGVGGYMLMTKHHEDAEDAKVDATEAPEELDEREALERMAAMAKEAADTLEGSKNGNGADTWVESDEKAGIGIESTSVSDMQLSMRATVTQEAPEEIQALFADIGNGNGAEEVDKEALRIDNLKRRYQNAIGRLPYGIPSAALRDRDWVDLAKALATGEKKKVEGGKEVTRIDGHWYYSDHEDTGSFLKEHGARPKAKERTTTATTVDKKALLAKLEERFILGEISEEAYKQLRKKYGGV
jgi:hypothetical protein